MDLEHNSWLVFKDKQIWFSGFIGFFAVFRELFGFAFRIIWTGFSDYLDLVFRNIWIGFSDYLDLVFRTILDLVLHLDIFKHHNDDTKIINKTAEL